MPDGVDTAYAADLVETALLGDFKTSLVDRIRGQKKPWSQLTEAEQKSVIDDADRVCRHLIRNAVEIIAAEGRPAIKARLESVAVKDGIKAVLSLSRFDEQRLRLVDMVGNQVMLVFADPEEFMGEGDGPKPDPDQPEMPLDTKAGGGDAPVFDKTDNGKAE